MANIKIKPLIGKIDEEWEEINMGHTKWHRTIM